MHSQKKMKHLLTYLLTWGVAVGRDVGLWYEIFMVVKSRWRQVMNWF